MTGLQGGALMEGGDVYLAPSSEMTLLPEQALLVVTLCHQAN